MNGAYGGISLHFTSLTFFLFSSFLWSLEYTRFLVWTLEGTLFRWWQTQYFQGMPTSESLPVLSGRSTFPWTAICLILSIFSPSLTTARNCGLDISPIALALNSTWDSIGDEARRKKLHWGLLTQVPGNSNSFMSLWPSLELNNIYVADPKWNLDRIINQEFANWITGGEVIMSRWELIYDMKWSRFIGWLW